MHIQALRINHYKTVEEPIVLDRFSHLQILIGPNNSGKTNVRSSSFLIHLLILTDFMIRALIWNLLCV